VCPVCGSEVPRAAVLRCPGCERPARLVEGDEIILARIEMEVE
jgi:Zn finger protein HypA/HybF involved in hydrogenase expression